MSYSVNFYGSKNIDQQNYAAERQQELDEVRAALQKAKEELEGLGHQNVNFSVPTA